MKRFKKIELNPNESKEISFTLSVDDFKYFDENKNGWNIENGEYEILIGSSSVDLPIKTIISIK